jgi:hypothetical protein
MLVMPNIGGFMFCDYRKVIALTVFVFGFLSLLQTPDLGGASGGYRVDPKIRRKVAREHLMSAMQLNATAAAMLQQGSDNLGKIGDMLNKAYGDYVRAIGALEGLNREAKFKDPMVDQAVSLLYQAKGTTLRAGGAAGEGRPEESLEHLQTARMMTKKAELLAGI